MWRKRLPAKKVKEPMLPFPQVLSGRGLLKPDRACSRQLQGKVQQAAHLPPPSYLPKGRITGSDGTEENSLQGEGRGGTPPAVFLWYDTVSPEGRVWSRCLLRVRTGNLSTVGLTFNPTTVMQHFSYGGSVLIGSWAVSLFTSFKIK